MRRKTMWRNIAKMAVGISLGLVLSVLPVVVLVPATLVLVVVVCVRICVLGWGCDAVTMLTTCIIVAICFVLPTKQLDVKVGPITYCDLSLADLCDRLKRDYGVICHVPDTSARTCRLSFSTSQPLSRKQVLEKLSRETNRPLHIGFCGTNASILFGACPSFTYLGKEWRGTRKRDTSDRLAQKNKGITRKQNNTAAGSSQQ